MISCFKQKPADLADLWKLTDYRRFLKKTVFYIPSILNLFLRFINFFIRFLCLKFQEK